MESKKVFQLIDLDRTLFDTSLFVKAICDSVDVYQPGLGAEIDKQFEESYRLEQSFFALEFIRRQLGRVSYDAFVEDAVHRIDAKSLLLPGAKERLELAESLSDLNPGYGLLTYSFYPEDQQLKVRLAGLEHIPMYIADTPDKAELIATWQLEDGTFKLPEAFGGQVVDELTLEDDKLRAFTGLPQGVTGFWLTGYDDAEQRLAQSGTQNVNIIRSLRDSVALLSSQFSS